MARFPFWKWITHCATGAIPSIKGESRIYDRIQLVFLPRLTMVYGRCIQN